MATKKRHKTPRLIHPDEWGEALHTALRKGRDSAPTSAAWNLIYLLDSGWRAYLDHLRKVLPKAMKPGQPVWQALKTVSLEWDYLRPDGDVPENVRNQRNDEAATLFCVLRCFDDRDWEGYAAYLER